MEKYFDLKMILSLVVTFIVIVVVVMIFRKMNGTDNTPAKTITKAQYDVLSADDKAKYTASSDGLTYSLKS